MKRIILWIVLTSINLVALAQSPRQLSEADRQLSHDILKQLIDINTTDSAGSTTDAANAMAQRLRDGGFPSEDLVVLGPSPRKGNLVARIHGTGAHKPILLIGHLDVVEARRSDWTTDPFQLIEKDGYYYGRGTQDMKGGDAILITNFIRLKRENFKPDRDIMLALTAAEEGGKDNGIDWLLKNHRNLIDAEYVLNSDAGGVDTSHGKPVSVDISGTEKAYADFQLMAMNPGGHSSLPTPDNAIYHVTNALTKLSQHRFPFELNNVTHAYLERMEKLEGSKAADIEAALKSPPDQAAIERLDVDPYFNAITHTTCVATRLEAGHANNALPQTAQANVNCRILPGHTREETRQDLIKLFDDSKLTIKYVADSGAVSDTAPNTGSLPPPPLQPNVMSSLERVAAQMWPGAPVIVTMETGASDGKYTNEAGLPTYGVSGIAIDQDDVRAHGKDERVRVNSYDDGVAFYYRFLKALTSAP